MVFKCCVPYCKSGYDETSSSNSNISMHKFPPNMERAWSRAINRDDFTVTKNSRVCSLHFQPSDFKDSSEDQNISRKKKKQLSGFIRRHLKESAIPSVFPGQPKYLSRIHLPERSGNSTCAARHQKVSDQLEELEKSMTENDRVSDLNDFAKDFIIPEGFDKIQKPSKLLFVYLNNRMSCLQASIVVNSDLSCDIYFHGQPIPLSKVSYLLASEKISSLTELSNVLALVKSWCEGEAEVLTTEDRLKKTILDLTQIVQRSTFPELLTFIIEQLKLIMIPINARHYSNELLIHAFLWHMTSPASYKVLKKMFLLPSVRRLQQLSSGMNVEANLVNGTYLKDRTSSLQSYEKTVVLMIDEIYTAKRVEYSNGTFVGLTSDGEPAKTVLSFMVQSVSSHYKDIVCIIPVNRLSAQDLLKYFRRVMVDLSEFVKVIAISVDNHAVNR